MCWVYVITCTPVDSSTFTHSFNRYSPCCPVPALLGYCSGTPSWHPAQIPRRSWRVKVISTALWQPLPAPAPTPATIANDFHFRIEMNAPLVVAASRVLQAEADEAEAEAEAKADADCALLCDSRRIRGSSVVHSGKWVRRGRINFPCRTHTHTLVPSSARTHTDTPGPANTHVATYVCSQRAR